MAKVKSAVRDAVEGGGSKARRFTGVLFANDAPVLADTALTLSQTEDAGAPSGAVGTLVSTLTGGISDVDTTAYGSQIIKLLAKTPAKKLVLTDKVPQTDLTIADKIKDFLTQQQTQKLAPAFLDGLKKKADVEILNEDLKAAIAALPAATNAPPETP